ncbi:MAG: oxaloacetate decarboxylase [Nitratireductor sp.]
MLPSASKLRGILSSSEPVIVPGAYDALTASLVEEAGFAAVYATGAGISNSQLALADVGLLTMSEMLYQVRRMASAVSVPIICDIDSGYGNAVNLFRTVDEFIRAGAAAVQIEDQIVPKRCGHFEGKHLVPINEAVLKIRAAVEARGDSGLVIIGRTDAIAVEGFERAIERAEAYHEAGADVLFVEAPRTEEEMAEIARRLPGPKVINLVEGGQTPILTHDQLREMGYAIVLYANLVLRTGIKAIQSNLHHLRQHGDTTALTDRMISFEERARLTRKEFVDDLEQRYVNAT